MKAIRLHAACDFDALQLDEIPIPSVQTDQDILVRLAAAGVNPIDTKIRRNPDAFPAELPMTLGCDAAGIIEQVGAGVSNFKPGDGVYFCVCGFRCQGGSYAEYAVVDQSFVAHRPESLSLQDSAAVPLAAITAWEALFERANLKTGDTVLIHAGAGGVGHIAIQLAKNAGAEVITTVSSQEKAQFASKLGADYCINYRSEDLVDRVHDITNGHGIDVALDTVGGTVFEQTIATLRYGGDLVTLLLPPQDTDWSGARQRNLRISFELMLTPMILRDSNSQRHQGAILKACTQLIEEGKLCVHISARLPLAQAAEAHKRIEAGSTIGKLILLVDEGLT